MLTLLASPSSLPALSSQRGIAAVSRQALRPRCRGATLAALATTEPAGDDAGDHSSIQLFRRQLEEQFAAEAEPTPRVVI